MDTQNFSIIDLERHVTKDMQDSHVNGELTVVWRDWDNIIKNPEMIYVNIVNPGEVKVHMFIKIEQVIFIVLKVK